MIIPFIAFWVLLIVCYDELGPKGALGFIALWAALLAGFYFTRISPLWFVAIQSLIDIGLILMVFGGDLKIR